MTMPRGTCPIQTCRAEDISPMHYARKHGIRLKDHFHAIKTSQGHRKYCIDHHEVRADGPHEAMVHLVEMHPELFPQESQDATLEILEQDTIVEASEQEKEVDPEWAFANATVGGVYGFLVEKRQEAEAEAECLRVEVGTLTEKLRIVIESSFVLELKVEELTERNSGLQQEISKGISENSRLVEDNREMNKDLLRIGNGAKSVTEFRETYGEMQGRRVI